MASLATVESWRRGRLTTTWMQMTISLIILIWEHSEFELNHVYLAYLSLPACFLFFKISGIKHSWIPPPHSHPLSWSVNMLLTVLPDKILSVLFCNYLLLLPIMSCKTLLSRIHVFVSVITDTPLVQNKYCCWMKKGPFIKSQANINM